MARDPRPMSPTLARQISEETGIPFGELRVAVFFDTTGVPRVLGAPGVRFVRTELPDEPGGADDVVQEGRPEAGTPPTALSGPCPTESGDSGSAGDPAPAMRVFAARAAAFYSEARVYECGKENCQPEWRRLWVKDAGHGRPDTWCFNPC